MSNPTAPSAAASTKPIADVGRQVLWSRWTLSEWGIALLEHFFYASPPVEPVFRLVVTAEELAKVVGATPDCATDARDAFLSAVACTPDQFRAHLRRSQLSRGRWSGERPPPFLPYLIFTCYAATTFDEAVAEEGDFRRRICELLGHPAGTTYDLQDLPALWLALREWLERLRESGVPARRLELPDPGYMSRIGYSVRLAFPQRRDREKLARIFAVSVGGVTTSPTVPEALALVDPHVRQFSADFQAVFIRAKHIFVRGGDGPDLRLVWSAFREAASHSPQAGAKATKPRFHLLAYDDDRGRLEPVVVTDREIDTGKTGIRCIALPNPIEEHLHYLSTSQDSPSAIVDLLLQRALAGDRLKMLSGSPIVRAVNDGVLLFRQVDGIAWSLCTTREKEGACRALVRRDLTILVRKLLPRTAIGVPTDRFAEWDELAGFDFADIADPVVVASELSSIRALQRVEAGAQIHLVGGLRTASGFLGTAALLPEVRCTDASEVSVLTSTAGATNTPPRLVDRLVPVPGRLGVFEWPRTRKAVDGQMVLVASNGAGEIASRHVVFESAVLDAGYRGASDPSRWLAEGGAKDVVCADAIDTFLGSRAPAHATVMPAFPHTGSGDAVATHSVGIDDDRRFDEFVEALACIGLRRHGVPEAEFIAIGERIGVLDREEAPWDVIRAWLEAGYLDALINPRWRGRTYVPRRPRLVAVPMVPGRTRVVLHGLPPRVVRHRVRQAFARDGAVEAPMARLSSCVPLPLAWRVDGDPVRLEEMARAAGIPLAWVTAAESLVGNLDEVFAAGASAPAANTLVRSWDWAEAGFRSSARLAVAQGVFLGPVEAADARPRIVVDYHARPDGPDEYHVTTQRGETIAVTRSRTWALLRAFAAEGQPPFVPLEDRYFVRAGVDGAHVPLPAARALALWSGTLSGPAEVALLGRRYLYATRDAAQRRRMLAKLSGRHLDDVDGRVLAWLHAAALARRGRGVRTPADLRRRLDAMADVPQAAALAGLTLPPHLLPHLRRALSPVSALPPRIL